MNPDKNAIVAQLAERLQGCPYVLLVDYTGMTVPQFNEMRKRLKGTSANFHVTKNSYIKAVGKFPKELEKAITMSAPPPRW
jgi:large subunit ribosomal protein L10